ncbi:MAG TPA: hypothetical protein VII47_04695 [Actinomycetota bacterium]|jgi:hypothetical protein
MRRLAAVVAAVAVVVGLAPAASAQLVTTQIAFLSPPEGAADVREWSPQPGSVVTGRWQIRVRATSSGALERLAVRLESEEEGLTPAGQGPQPRVYSLLTPTAQDELSFEWDTVASTPLNGRYRWVAEASSYLGAPTTAVLGDLKVSNPPEPPGSVSVRLEGPTPVVSWGPPAEQDVVGWRVWRAPAGTDSFAPVGTVQVRELRDAGAPPGSQVYAVNAVRRSPATAGGVASQLSAPTAPVQVPGVVASPPVPSPLPTVRGIPQPAGTFNPDLPYALPSVAGPSAVPSHDAASLPASAGPVPASHPAAARPPRSPAPDRVRFWVAGVLLLGAGALAWRFRRKVLTGR